MVLFTASEKSTSGNGKLLLICGIGVLCLITVLFTSNFDTVLFVTRIKMRAYNGSVVHEFLKKSLKPAHISAYLFNITNAQEFLSGKDYKLKVNEVGPFTYSETRYNEDLEIDEDAGVIRYTPRTEVVFLPEESVARPEEVNVTMPNLPMLGLASTISSYPYFSRLAFNLLTTQLNSKPIVTKDASTYLWGYKEPLVTLGHNIIPGKIHFDKIGILDRFYDKNRKNRIEIGAEDHNRFMIQTRNGHKKLEMGSFNPDLCEICDNFTNSYEGIGYPCGMDDTSPVRIFKNGLCRMLDMDFHKHVMMDLSVPALQYNLSDSFYSLDPNVTENRVLDLTECWYGLPVALSKAKFLDLDPSMYERIEGITPDPNMNSFIIIERKISIEMESYFAVQFNLQLQDLSHSPTAKPFSNMLLPIGYVVIDQPPLPEETLKILHEMYIFWPTVTLIVDIILSIISLLTISYAVMLYWRRKKLLFSNEKSIILNAQQQPLVEKKVVIL